jgi:hypothetical protein
MTETPETEKSSTPTAPPPKRRAAPTPPPPDVGLAKVLAKAPKHAGCKVKIHKLWNNHYRVNYHEMGPESIIVHSYFAVILEDDKINFTWDEKVNEFEKVTKSEIK